MWSLDSTRANINSILVLIEYTKKVIYLGDEEIAKIGTELIEDDLMIIDKDNTLKHDSLKLSSLIFSYLMRLK